MAASISFNSNWTSGSSVAPLAWYWLKYQVLRLVDQPEAAIEGTQGTTTASSAEKEGEPLGATKSQRSGLSTLWKCFVLIITIGIRQLQSLLRVRVPNVTQAATMDPTGGIGPSVRLCTSGSR